MWLSLFVLESYRRRAILPLTKLLLYRRHLKIRQILQFVICPDQHFRLFDCPVRESEERSRKILRLINEKHV